jgi:hypothetical protein
MVGKRSAFIAVGAVCALFMSVSAASADDGKTGGAKSCGPDQLVHIVWQTTASSVDWVTWEVTNVQLHSSRYYAKSGGRYLHNVNTGHRSIPGWSVGSYGTIYGAGAVCQ